MNSFKIVAASWVSLMLAGLVFFGLAPQARAACEPGYSNLRGSTTVCCPNGSQGSATACTYAKYINPIISLLSIIAGLAVVAGIILGSIEYAASGGDPQKAASGKGKIVKAIYGLVVFMFLYSLLQFFSPGGVGANPTPSGQGTTIAQKCAKPFLGLKPWYIYLPDNAFQPGTCNIQNFSLLGGKAVDATGKSVSTPSQVPAVLLAVADALLRIAGIVAVAFVIVGGIKFITSNGEPDKTKTARDAILNALIGVAMAIVAASVVSFIGSRLSS